MTFAVVTLAALLAAAPQPAPSAASFPSAAAEFRITVHGSADATFPLFDPLHEGVWAPGWDPHFTSSSRVAEGMAFTTGDNGRRSVWYVDRYDLTQRRIRYIIVRGDVVSELDIHVEPVDAVHSEATVHHVQTALTPAAVETVREMAKSFPNQGPHWEAAINGYLDKR